MKEAVKFYDVHVCFYNAQRWDLPLFRLVDSLQCGYSKSTGLKTCTSHFFLQCTEGPLVTFKYTLRNFTSLSNDYVCSTKIIKIEIQCSDVMS